MSEACAEIVQRTDPERFAALMAAPVIDRPALAVLYAFNAEVARAPWASKEPMIAEMRLQWWRDAITAAAAGGGQPHEVMTPLGKLIRDKGLPVEALDGMVAARQWDVWREPHADAAALWRYLEETGGALLWLAAKALGAPDSAEAAARGLGSAQALANYLRAVPQLETLGRIPLVDGTPAGVAALAREGLARLHRVRGPIPRSAALAAFLTRPVLALAAEEPARVADGTLDLSEFTRRKRLLWQSLTGRF